MFKKYLFGLAFLLLWFANAFGQSGSYTDTQIAMGIDFAKSGLYEKAKEILIPLLHDTLAPNSDPEIRYILGSICFFEQDDYDCGWYHWGIVLTETPNCPQADVIRDIQRTNSFFDEEMLLNAYEDYAFQDELKLSRRFWTYEPPDWKMKWEDLKNPQLAVSYLDKFLERYDDPSKRAVLMWDKFMILAGYCHEEFGYLHAPEDIYVQRKDGDSRSPRSHYLVYCEELSDSLHANPVGIDYYVASQFLLGIMTSGTKFLSSKIKLNEQSAKYFENVVKTVGEETTNPYGVFASLWLKEYHR